MPIEAEPRRRVIFYDIETAPSLGYYFDLYKEGNIVSTVQSWFMLSFAYKVQGERKIHYHCLADYPGHKKNKKDDKALVTDLHRLVFSSCDLLVGHNIDRFDNRKSRARFLAHGLPPTPPIKTVDTLKLAKRVGKFDSNRAGALGIEFGLGGKAVTTGWDLWERCIEGDPKAFRQMGVYNRRDIELAEQIYNRLMPWHPNPPYLGPGCPSCFSDHVTRQGFSISRSGRRQQLQCQDCGAWFHETKKTAPLHPAMAAIPRKSRSRSDARRLG